MDAAYFTALYEAFEDQKQMFIDAGVPPVALIDKFRGQPLNPEQFEYFPLPAIFVQRSAAWTRDGNTYKATWSLIFHVVCDATWETSNIATNKEEGFKYFTFLDLVRQVLDNFTTAFTGTMFRQNDEPIDTGVVVYEALGYACQYYGSTPVGTQYDYGEPETITIGGKVKRKKLKKPEIPD